MKEPDIEDKPTPPDLSAIVDAYDHPTLPLSQDDVDAFYDFAQEVADRIEALDLEEQIIDPVREALEEDDNEGLGGAAAATGRAPLAADGQVRTKSQTVALEGEGFLRVTRVCKGWGEPVVDEEKNGSSLALLGFTDGGIDPVIWGDFTDCRYPTRAGNVLLTTGDGALDFGFALHLGGVTKPSDLGKAPILYVLNLDSTIGATSAQVRFSFRVDRERGRFEVLYETGAGSLVLFVEGGDLVGLRAQDGE